MYAQLAIDAIEAVVSTANAFPSPEVVVCRLHEALLAIGSSYLLAYASDQLFRRIIDWLGKINREVGIL